MFKKAILSTLFLLALIAAYLFYYSCYILPKDIKTYEETKKKITTQEKDLAPTYQERRFVQKDIWSSDFSHRLHYQIQADSSTLCLTPSSKGMLLEESMHHIFCLIQEKITFRDKGDLIQNIKSFTSEFGTYDFHNKRFTADFVLLNFYIAEGEILPSISTLPLPYLKGKAQTVIFSLASHTPYFHAEKFKGTLISEGGVIR